MTTAVNWYRVNLEHQLTLLIQSDIMQRSVTYCLQDQNFT